MIQLIKEIEWAVALNAYRRLDKNRADPEAMKVREGFLKAARLVVTEAINNGWLEEDEDYQVAEGVQEAAAAAEGVLPPAEGLLGEAPDLRGLRSAEVHGHPPQVGTGI
jgi:hypothetical protein